VIEDVGAVEACAQEIKSFLAPIAALPVAPPVLQPAALYLELVGENIRRRAVLTSNDALCLRPDMTVPAACLALSLPRWHGAGFALTYDGRVFRRVEAGTQPREPRQIGVEWYAPVAHSAERDAANLLAALGACQATGAPAGLVLGCAALSRAVIEASGLPEALARTLLRTHDVRGAIAAAQAAEEQPAAPISAVGSALAKVSSDEAAGLLGEILALAGVSQLGGRPLPEVAARLRAKSLAGAQSSGDGKVLAKLAAVFAIENEPLAAFGALRPAIAKLDAPAPALTRVDALEHIWKNVLAAGPQPGKAVFRTAFDRSLDYYDGLAFDLIGANGAVLGGGGRYDQVLPALAQAQACQLTQALSWGAAGFAVYPAALAAERAP
jgi:ATP phosphoribosyltransferase regulatory subunit